MLCCAEDEHLQRATFLLCTTQHSSVARRPRILVSVSVRACAHRWSQRPLPGCSTRPSGLETGSLHSMESLCRETSLIGVEPLRRDSADNDGSSPAPRRRLRRLPHSFAAQSTTLVDALLQPLLLQCFHCILVCSKILFYI